MNIKNISNEALFHKYLTFNFNEEYFDKQYLEVEQKRKELELRIKRALKESDIEAAKVLCEQLEQIITEGVSV